jgi:hypothetical protein
MAGLGPPQFDDPQFVWPSDRTISNVMATFLSYGTKMR